ncbi:MAG: hypothetical protein ACTSXF_05010 [Promethearchaeota archaeon]
MVKDSSPTTMATDDYTDTIITEHLLDNLFRNIITIFSKISLNDLLNLTCNEIIKCPYFRNCPKSKSSLKHDNSNNKIKTLPKFDLCPIYKLYDRTQFISFNIPFRMKTDEIYVQKRLRANNNSFEFEKSTSSSNESYNLIDELDFFSEVSELLGDNCKAQDNLQNNPPKIEKLLKTIEIENGDNGDNRGDNRGVNNKENNTLITIPFSFGQYLVVHHPFFDFIPLIPLLINHTIKNFIDLFNYYLNQFKFDDYSSAISNLSFKYPKTPQIIYNYIINKTNLIDIFTQLSKLKNLEKFNCQLKAIQYIKKPFQNFPFLNTSQNAQLWKKNLFSLNINDIIIVNGFAKNFALALIDAFIKNLQLIKSIKFIQFYLNIILIKTFNQEIPPHIIKYLEIKLSQLSPLNRTYIDHNPFFHFDAHLLIKNSYNNSALIQPSFLPFNFIKNLFELKSKITLQISGYNKPPEQLQFLFDQKNNFNTSLSKQSLFLELLEHQLLDRLESLKILNPLSAILYSILYKFDLLNFNIPIINNIDVNNNGNYVDNDVNNNVNNDVNNGVNNDVNNDNNNNTINPYLNNYHNIPLKKLTPPLNKSDLYKNIVQNYLSLFKNILNFSLLRTLQNYPSPPFVINKKTPNKNIPSSIINNYKDILVNDLNLKNIYIPQIIKNNIPQFINNLFKNYFDINSNYNNNKNNNNKNNIKQKYDSFFSSNLVIYPCHIQKIYIPSLKNNMQWKVIIDFPNLPLNIIILNLIQLTGLSVKNYNNITLIVK